MCRLLGAVSRRPESHPLSLAEAPRSLASLSPEHPHGWGIALHDGRGWALHKRPTCAQVDQQFRKVAQSLSGKVLVAHIRKATVGRTHVSNTHPFRRDAWMFAHNGTIEDIAYFERRTSASRRREVEGDTDSERFFAFLMTALDEVGAALGSRRAVRGAVDRALCSAVAAAVERPKIGAINFLLSDGEVLYAHRFGRTLHVRTDSAAGAVLLASEQVGVDDAWEEVPEGTLLRVDGGACPRWETVGLVDSRRSPARRGSIPPRASV
jgi:glutamine amidotransferase